MSNTRKAGRKNKRPFRQIGPKNPTTELMSAVLSRGVGAFMIEYQHDEWCLAQHSQRFEDCTCDPDHVLLKYDPSVMEGK